MAVSMMCLLLMVGGGGLFCYAKQVLATDWFHVSFETRPSLNSPTAPQKSKDLSGSVNQFVLDINRNGGRILDSVPGALVLTARSPLWISLSSPVQWGSWHLLPLLHKTMVRPHEVIVVKWLWKVSGVKLGRTRLCAKWLGCINSFCLPDNRVGQVLLLSQFCPYKNWSAGKERDLLCHLTDNEANGDSQKRWLGSRACVLKYYLFERRDQVFLQMAVP